MEEDDSGLKVAKYIREDLNNKLVRIILRTGQPGQAPEKRVIIDYDVNDYKEKTELTSQKLFTTVVAALRAYCDISIIDVNKKGLEQIIKSSAQIFELQSMRKFTSGVLTQLTSLLKLNKSAMYCHISSMAATKNEENFYVMAATGDYCKNINKNITEVVPANIKTNIEKAFNEKRNIYVDDEIVAYFQSKIGSENIIYLEGISDLTELDRDLIEIFCSNISVAFDNIYLNKEVESTQKEIIYTLGEIAEARSRETGHHVKRVAEYSRLLAYKYGLSEEECEMIRMASPMHDVGKLGVPDYILNKPGKLDPDEFEIIKTHSMIGFDMLKNSQRNIMKAASVIALEHHEKFNGKGYPKGLKGEEIHIYGRITALADVFDALGNDRVYKKAWELDKILELLKEEQGEHFDPVLVDIFFDNLQEILAISKAFPESIKDN
jgi:response regulator RpfG family c-di-GMP phosphodiesterase